MKDGSWLSSESLELAAHLEEEEVICKSQVGAQAPGMCRQLVSGSDGVPGLGVKREERLNKTQGPKVKPTLLMALTFKVFMDTLLFVLFPTTHVWEGDSNCAFHLRVPSTTALEVLVLTIWGSQGRASMFR